MPPITVTVTRPFPGIVQYTADKYQIEKIAALVTAAEYVLELSPRIATLVGLANTEKPLRGALDTGIAVFCAVFAGVF
jgi:hypothetical protein